MALHVVAEKGEEIRYVDVTSLLPVGEQELPLPHPQIITQPVDQSMGLYFGIATVYILPPAGLFHPVLPVRSGNKLIFPLCRICVQEEQAKPMLNRSHYCHHSDHSDLHLDYYHHIRSSLIGCYAVLGASPSRSKQ